ncbi:aromatic ring-hydroxylating oxygenase subunit alpha [Cumulibacter manganitolerans]|uniref:aromatic ring-hydroxylating oxygenase subunit alpha n=1 Tax=Cumulibacter manganitolerans TaxID=1884992 RepID=UPI001295A34C|nr:aromatic ring-hydroxylating dioxygenase subunit alpha [Cumulibacter manganitolerans]
MDPFANDREDRIRRLLEHLRHGTTDRVGEVAPFEPRDYRDPDLAALERDRIFGQVPTIVAHGSELPEPHDFITLQMPRNRVIISRQKDGSVRAVVNACRHRGAMLENKDSGRCRLFSCPYHRWSYETDGTLRAVTRDTTFGDIDRSQLNLVALPVEERHGFIWLIDNANASIDVAAWLGPRMDAILASYHLDEYVVSQTAAFEEPVNWKLMQDAFIDGYHVQYAHPNTAGKHVHTNVQVVEDFGNSCRFVSPRKTIDRYLEEDPGDKSLAKHVIEAHFLSLSSTLLKQPDHFQLLSFRPDAADPARGRMEIRLITRRPEDLGVDRAAWERNRDKNWQILIDVLLDEDFPILRDSQQALLSADAAGMLLGRNEFVNHVFRRELRRILASDSLEEYLAGCEQSAQQSARYSLTG